MFINMFWLGTDYGCDICELNYLFSNVDDVYDYFYDNVILESY